MYDFFNISVDGDIWESKLFVYSFIVILAIPAIGVVWIVRKIRAPKIKQRNAEEEILYKEQALELLQNTDFPAVEKHFGVILPVVIKEFYASDMVGEDCDLKINDDEWYIAYFRRLDADSLSESWPGCEKFVSIATDGCGNDYVFDPQSEVKAVKFHDHETGEFEEVTPTLDEFLAIVTKEIGRLNK